MEHIVQFAVSIDDNAITARVSENAEKEIIKDLKQQVANKLFESRYYRRNVDPKNDPLSEFAKEIVYAFLEENKNVIIENASKMLAEKLELEYEKGNYVIAGGDFNQTFEGMDKYPILDKENWTPGIIGHEDIPDGFSFAVADNVPTCRLLNEAYSGNYTDSQVYVLDGFIVSDNVKVDEIRNIDMDFTYADHQPVRLQVTLQ